MIDNEQHTDMRIYRTRVSYKRGYTGRRGSYTEYSFYIDGSKVKTGESHRFPSVTSFKKKVAKVYDVDPNDIVVDEFVGTRNK